MKPTLPSPLRLHLKTISAQGSLIILIGRDENGRRYTIQVSGFRPYFYVLRTEELNLRKKGLDYVEGLPTLTGEQTFKVFVDQPASIPRRRKGFSRTWEGDVPFTRRFLVDTGIHDGFRLVGDYRVLHSDATGSLIMASVANLQPVSFRTPDRQVLYDIETNKPEGSRHYSPPVEAAGAVTALTLHDSFEEGRFVTYWWHPERGQVGRPQVEVRSQWSDAYGRDVPWTVHTYGSEQEFLIAFLNHLKRTRPDVLQAWNGHHGHHRKNRGGFDAPYLINRLKRIGLSPGQLSPLGNAFAGYRVFGKEASQATGGKWQCGIDGVQLADMMTIYQISDGGFTAQVPFSDLKRVTEKFVGKVLKKDPSQIECVGENELILRPDLTWTRAGDLKVGDEVASFDEGTPVRTVGRPKKGQTRDYPTAGRRQFRVGRVLHNDVQEMEAFRVELDDGSCVTTTANHPWLSHSTSEKVWIQTKYLQPGRPVSKMLDVHQLLRDRDAGWLAGMFDGEGTLHQKPGLTISVAQRPGPLLTRLEEELQRRGFSYDRYERHNYTGLGKGDCVRLQITGGREETLRFLMQVRPHRFLEKFDWEKLGVVRIDRDVRVVKVVPVGKQRIARLSVDCETYVAEGFLMHNSWWLHNSEQFLVYSFNDVDALVALERKQKYLEFARGMQQFVGAEDANKLFAPMALITTKLLRIAQREGVCVPTSGSEDGDEDYQAEGGFVLEPRVKGIQRRIGVLDLTAMYVHIILSGNISPETHVPNPTEEQMKDLICLPSDLGPQFFLKPAVKKGIIPLVCEEFRSVRKQYDDLIEKAQSAEEVKRLKHQRQPAKQLLLGVWGVSLSPLFCLWKMEVGSSITGTGRFVIKSTDEFVASLGDRVVYTDTDSTFIPLPEEDPVGHGEWLAERVNENFDIVAASMNMDSHTFEIGLETIYDPFIMGDTKKLYAGNIVWSEGKWQVDEDGRPKPVFTPAGISGIKSDAAPITREVSLAILKALLAGSKDRDVLEYVSSIHDGILAGEVPLEDIIKATTLNQDADNPALNTHIVKAVRYGKATYDFEYPIGAKVRIVRLRNAEAEWVAIPEGEDLPEDLPVDMSYHADLVVLRPAQSILNWVNLSVESIRHGTPMTVQRRL